MKWLYEPPTHKSHTQMSEHNGAFLLGNLGIIRDGSLNDAKLSKGLCAAPEVVFWTVIAFSTLHSGINMKFLEDDKNAPLCSDI